MDFLRSRPYRIDNVKNEEFLKKSITMFWERYGGKTYEGLPPKMAIFAASVAEATDVVKACCREDFK